MARSLAIVSRANRRLSVSLAATLLASSSLISSGLGLFRDRLLNSTYYDTYKPGLDAYTVAFIIPDFMFFILVSGALSVSFIPVFNERLTHGNKKSAWELSTSIVNLLAIVTLIASVLIIIFADPLVRFIVGPGLDESGRGLAVSMMRVIAINPFLFAVASVVASMQQAVGRFTFFALAPAVYNAGIIVGITWFANGINLFGWQVFDGGIMGVAFGVVLGSIMQLLISSIGLLGLGFDYRFKIYWKNKGFRKVLSLLPARSLDQGIDYINGIVETNIASRLASGTIRAYQQASTLYMMPVNLVGVAISTAAFPKMTERLAQGRPDLFRKELQTVLRAIVWLILPISIVAFFGRGYIITFIKNGGDVLMANLLGLLAIAIVFRAVYHICARSFYAQQDTKTPLYVSLFTIALNITLAILLTLVWHKGAYGLAIAQDVVAGLEVLILFVIMHRRIKGMFDRNLLNAIGKMLIAVSITAIVTYLTIAIIPVGAKDQTFFSVFPKFVLITAITFGVYFGISYLFRLPETEPVIRRVRNVIFRQYKPTEGGHI